MQKIRRWKIQYNGWMALGIKGKNSDTRETLKGIKRSGNADAVPTFLCVLQIIFCIGHYRNDHHLDYTDFLENKTIWTQTSFSIENHRRYSPNTSIWCLKKYQKIFKKILEYALQWKKILIIPQHPPFSHKCWWRESRESL